MDSLGYLWLEVFLLSMASGAAGLVVAMWVMDGSGYLNMSNDERKRISEERRRQRYES